MRRALSGPLCTASIVSYMWLCPSALQVDCQVLVLVLFILLFLFFIFIILFFILSGVWFYDQIHVLVGTPSALQNSFISSFGGEAVGKV